MDHQLRLLKRTIVSSPSDVEALHRYIVALERVVGGTEQEPTPRRSGWECPDPEFLENLRDDASNVPAEFLAETILRPNGGCSPDGVCVYSSEAGDDGCRYVELVIDGQPMMWKMPADYTGESESEDWCIFCGDPSERK